MQHAFQRRKKTVTIIILIVWFIWSAGKDVDNLIRATGTTDYYIFSSNGLTPVFFFFAVAVTLLDAATVSYLFRPRPAGFYVALSALALSVIQSIISVSLALSDLSGVRQAYAAGREARGLSVREEALDTIFTPEAMYLVLALLVLINAVAAFLIVLNRDYFFSSNINSTTPPGVSI